MVRQLLTVTGVAAAIILCQGRTADAGEFRAPYISDDGLTDGSRSGATAFEAGYVFELGNWSLTPVADLRAASDTPVGGADTQADRSSDMLVGRLGVRGAAKVHSRFGAIYSRLSLSFEHVFRTSAYQTVTGLSGGGRNGYYANRSEIDVMTLDAAFAMQLAKDVTGFVDYGAEIDPGSGIEHQAMLRLKFGF